MGTQDEECQWLTTFEHGPQPEPVEQLYVHQVLRFCFGAEKLSGGRQTGFGESHGSVSALSQNAAGSHLLSGYASGRVAVWRLHSVNSIQDTQEHVRSKFTEENQADQLQTIVDQGMNDHGEALSRWKMNTSSAPQQPVLRPNTTDRVSGRLLFVVDDAHGAGQAIAMCSFTTISSLAVCVDTGGSAFQIHFRRGLATGVKKEATCFFSGSRGEICGLEALGFSSAYADHTTDCSPSLSMKDRSKFFGNSLGSEALVAMASFTKIIVVKLRPRIQIVYWRPFKGPPDCLPLLAWQWDYRTCSCGASSHALLAFGRGSSIHILRVSNEGTGEATRFLIGVDAETLRFELLHSVELTFNLTSLKWLSTENRLAVVDVSETLHLIDASSGEDIESIDMSPLHMLYHRDLFRSVAAGGSVSEALAVAGHCACTYSVVAYDLQLLILGQTGIHLFSLRTWSQIVKSLFSHGEIEVALVHCVNVLRGTTFKLTSVLPETSPLRLPPVTVGHIPENRIPQQKLETEILLMLRQFVLQPLATAGHDAWKVTAESVETLLDIASLLGATEFVTSELFPLLNSVPEWRSWFFVALFKLIQTLRPFGQLRDVTTITSAQLNRSYQGTCYSLRPDITRDLLDWCLDPEQDTYRLTLESRTISNQTVGQSWAEMCVLKLAPTSLDLDQSIKLCWRHRLYSAYLHLCTDILLDFETPFNVLYNQLALDVPGEQESDITKSRTVDTECGHHLLVLVRSAFAAESCSHDLLPSPMDTDIPKQIFNLLQSGHSTQQSSTSGRPLSLLLRHNPVDFLNLLTLSISADAFFQDETFGFSHRSRLYRALISCSLELDATQLAHSSVPSYPVHVFIFVIHQLTLEADPKNVLDFALLFKLFSRICCEFKVYLRNNSLPFESAVTDLISRNRLTTLDDWLFLAQRAQCYHICEYIHRLRNETFEAFRDQLTALQYSLLPCPSSVTEATYTGGRADSESHPAGVRIFSFLEILFTAGEPKEDTLHSLHLTHEDVCNIKTLCLEKITFLARYDAERTLHLLSLMFDTPITNVLSRISTSFDRYKVGTTNGSTDQSNNLACLLLLRVYFQCRHRLISHADNSEASSPADTRDKSWESFLNNVSPEVAGFFVFLLVDSGASESELLQFLVTNHDYDAPSLFQTITPQAYPRALAFLYERLGDLDKALETHEQSFRWNWASLVHEYHASALGPAESTNSVQPTRLEPIQTTLTETFQHQRTAVHSVADNWFSFCQRYQSLLKENAKNVWFRVIDLLMEEQSSVSESFLISELNEIFHDLLSFVTTSLSLTAIISYILQKQSSSDSVAKFTKQTSAFVTRLVTTCHFEAEQTALNRGLARHDLTLQQLGFLARFRRGCCAIQAWCDLCAHRLRYEALSDTNYFESTRSSGHCVLLFRCGHVFHFACVYEDQKATAMDTQQSDLHLVCPMCLADTDVNTVHLTKAFGRSRRGPFVNHSDDPIRVEIAKRDVRVPPNPFDE